MMAVATSGSADKLDSTANPIKNRSTINTANSNSSEGDLTVFQHLLKESLEKLETYQDSNNLNKVLHNMFNPVADDSSPLPVDTSKLLIVLHTFSRELSKVNRNGGTSAILHLLNFDQWFLISNEVTDSYLQFFSILTSASPKWWTEIASRIATQMSEDATDYSAHHEVLKKILHLVPTSTTALTSILVAGFPHKTSSSKMLSSYVQNLLKVVDYAPEQRTGVWELIIQRVLEIDVECVDIQTEYKGGSSLDDSESDSSESDSDSDSGSENELSGSSDSESDEEESDSDDAMDVDEAAPVAGQKRPSVDRSSIPVKKVRADDFQEGEEVTASQLAMADMESEPMQEKIDELMSVLLSHLATKFTNEQNSNGESAELFNVLLHVFKKFVLPTSEPHAVQFLWFYVAHTNQEYLANFVSMLLETALMAKVDQEQKTRAIQYVASFVSRANGLGKDQLVFVVSVIADWIKRYMKEHEREVEASLSMAKFKQFYAAVQSIFYIFVFKHHDLRIEDQEKGNRKWVADLDKLLPQVVNSKFNPLQYCMPLVVTMFSRISQENEVASCYSIIEHNRWGRFKAGQTNKNTYQSMHTKLTQGGMFAFNKDAKLYDAYFPFQPLNLEGTKKYIAPFYQNWSDSDSDSDSGVDAFKVDSETELSSLDSSSEDSDSGSGSGSGSDSDSD